MADPKGYAKTQVFGSDVYSPRYPTIHYKIKDSAIQSIKSEISKGIEKAGPWYADLDELQRRGAGYLKTVPQIRIQFAEDNGISVPEILDQNGRKEGYLMGDKAERGIYEAKLLDKFGEFVDGLFNKLSPEEAIFSGYNNLGRRKYKPHTLENVVNALKKDLRGGESQSNIYGPGQLRAKFTPKFRSIEQIRKAKGKLTTKENFEKIKAEVESNLLSISDKMKSYYKHKPPMFGFQDTVMAVMEDTPKKGLSNALNEYDFEDVPEEIKTEIRGFMQKLVDLPTEYFEAKILRGVALHEFRGAVVPEGTKPELISLLEKRGLEIQTYKKGDEAGRLKAVDALATQLGSQSLFEKKSPYAAGPNQLDLWRPTGEGQHQRPVDIPKALRESIVVKELKETGFLDVHTTTIESPEDIAAIFSFMQDNNMESMYAIGMDGAGKMLGVQMVGMGNINQIPISARDTLAGMHAMGAAKVSFAHNHPSHDPNPSKEDIHLTKILADLAKSADMEVLHHIVIDGRTFGLVHPDGRVEMRPFSQPKPATATVRTVAPQQKWDVDEELKLVDQPEIAAELLSGFQRKHPGVVLLALNTKNKVNSIWHVSPNLPISPGKLAAEIGKIAMRNAAASVIVSTNLSPNAAYVKAIKSRLSPWGVDVLDWVGFPGNSAPITSARRQGIIGESKASYGTPAKESGGGYGGKPPVPPASRGSDFGSGDAYEANRLLAKKGSFTHYKAGDILKASKDLAETILTPISTVLKNIDPSLKVAIRHHVFTVMKNTHDDLHTAMPFMARADTMPQDDQADLDLAGKNGDISKIKEILSKHGAWAEYDAYRRTMDSLRDRAIASGVDMGYLSDYFPRIVEDKAGFLEAVQADTRWPDIAALIEQAETGGILSDDDKIALINNYLRGYSQGFINIKTPGNVKTRTIAILSPRMNRFYMDWRPAAIRYVEGMNKMIGDRAFFGKSAKNVDEGPDLFGINKNKIDTDKSIGAFIKDAVESGRVKRLDEQGLRDTLDAYFNQKTPGLAIKIYRDITTMQTIGNAIAALTQLQDIGVSLYRAPLEAIPNFIKAFVNRSEIKLTDLGLDSIAEEFSTRTKLSRSVSAVLKLSGLTSLDRITAETTINSIIEKYRSQARRGMVGGLEERLRAAVGEKWEKVADELANGKTSPDVLELAFNEILDVQPKALTELPRGYLKGGNARIFYMLKTFQLRQMDYIRAEAFHKMDQPGLKNKAIGMGRLISMVAVLGAMGVTADQLKDWVLGRKTDFSDRIIDNILKLAGLSKWTIYKARQEGFGSALMKTILPPAPIIDQLWKDVATAGDRKGVESVQSIPLVGKPYYWRFGRGREKTLAKHPELRTPSIDSRGRTIRPRPAPTQRSQLRQRVMVKR